MRLKIAVSMDYQLGGIPGEDRAVLLTVAAAQTPGQVVLHSDLRIDHATLTHLDGDAGVGARVWASLPTDRLTLRYDALVDITRPALLLEPLHATPLPALPGDVLPFLRPSRFCQSDLFTDFAGQQFGHLAGGAKIAAIRDWIGAALRYVPASSNSGTSVIDTFATRQGVCRDYAHLMCCLARASGIPARYASVYGPDVAPADFHAVAQVWLDGGWHLVDATGMCRPDALVLIGVGRDAGDIAFMESQVWADVLTQDIIVTRI